MNRRTLLASVATVTASTAGCLGITSREPTQSESDPIPAGLSDSELPEQVIATQPLMESFGQLIMDYYPDASLYTHSSGDLYFEYESEKESANGFETEIHQIADVYIDAAEGHDVVTLTILAQGVKAVVPRTTAQKHLDGELDQDAFHETIGLLSRD